MSLYPYRLYCQRLDRSRNRARNYALSIQPTLFGEIAVVRYWGRIGKQGGEKSKIFATSREAAVYFLDLARVKRRKGYQPVKTDEKLWKSGLSAT